jgi:hypothetical protein
MPATPVPDEEEVILLPLGPDLTQTIGGLLPAPFEPSIPAALAIPPLVPFLVWFQRDRGSGEEEVDWAQYSGSIGLVRDVSNGSLIQCCLQLSDECLQIIEREDSPADHALKGSLYKSDQALV